MKEIFFDACDTLYRSIYDNANVEVFLNARIYFNVARGSTELYDWVTYFKDCMTIREGYDELDEINVILNAHTLYYNYTNSYWHKRYILRLRDKRLTNMEVIEKLEKKIENGFNTFLKENNMSNFIIPILDKNIPYYNNLTNSEEQ